jgi:hypothetical protein
MTILYRRRVSRPIIQNFANLRPYAICRWVRFIYSIWGRDGVGSALSAAVVWSVIYAAKDMAMPLRQDSLVEGYPLSYLPLPSALRSPHTCHIPPRPLMRDVGWTKLTRVLSTLNRNMSSQSLSALAQPGVHPNCRLIRLCGENQISGIQGSICVCYKHHLCSEECCWITTPVCWAAHAPDCCPTSLF